MPTHKSYHSYLIESLKDPLEAAAYLEAVIEDGDAEHVALALKNVAEARRADKENLDKSDSSEHSYQSVIQESVPELSKISAILSDLGLKLSISVKDRKVA